MAGLTEAAEEDDLLNAKTQAAKRAKRKREMDEAEVRGLQEEMKTFPQSEVTVAHAVTGSEDLLDALTRAEAHLNACREWVRKRRASRLGPAECAFAAELYCSDLVTLQRMADEEFEHKSPSDDVALACAQVVHENHMDDLARQLDTSTIALARLPLFVKDVSHVTLDSESLCVHIPRLNAEFQVPHRGCEIAITHLNHVYMLGQDASGAVIQRNTATGDVMHTFAPRVRPDHDVKYCVSVNKLLTVFVFRHSTLMVDEFCLLTGERRSSANFHTASTPLSIARQGSRVALLERDDNGKYGVRIYSWDGDGATRVWRSETTPVALFASDRPHAVYVLTCDADASSLWTSSPVNTSCIWTRPDRCRVFNDTFVFNDLREPTVVRL